MGDSTSEPRPAEATRRGGSGPVGSPVLTPPTGIPALPDVTGASPVARPEATAPSAGPTTPHETVVDPCACGHAREAHEHYRRGSDCGVCGSVECAEYRRKSGLVRRTLRRMRLMA